MKTQRLSQHKRPNMATSIIAVSSRLRLCFAGRRRLDSLRLSLLVFSCPLLAMGQSFSSGSSGVDGPLDLSVGDRSVALPASGILNYTTINIPTGRTLSFQNNLGNTPVIILAQGAVNVAGTID